MTEADDPKKAAQDSGSRSDVSGEPETAAQTIDRLSQELAEKTAEASRNWDLYLRDRAEAENFRKRLQREKVEAIRFAAEPLARDLLSVIDNLERAVEHAASGGNGQPLIEGVQLVLRQALDVLERHGVTRVDAAAGPFDPSRHEAVMQIPDPNRAPNQIVEQFQPGYTLHDRLLRPAKVSVSAKPPVEDPQNDG